MFDKPVRRHKHSMPDGTDIAIEDYAEFDYVTHHGDVGHTIVVGERGGGKTVLLQTLLERARDHDRNARHVGTISDA